METLLLQLSTFYIEVLCFLVLLDFWRKYLKFNLCVIYSGKFIEILWTNIKLIR
jgi:hypothetical protein